MKWSSCQDRNQVEIGGNDKYVSVSRAEYKRIFFWQGTIEPIQLSLPIEDKKLMRIVFWWNSDFAVEPLKQLIQNNYDVVAVYTQPDKGIGRGKKSPNIQSNNMH